MKLAPAARMTLATLLLMPMSVSALAQLKPETQLGSRLAVQPKAVDPAVAARISKDVAKCVLAGRSTFVAKFLSNSDPVLVDFKAMGTTDRKITDDLGMPSCLEAQMNITQSATRMSFPISTLRTLLAEESYLKAYVNSPRLPESAVEPVARHFVSQGEELNRARGLAAFADCITFNDVVGADKVLRTQPRSVDEKAAARALAPTLGKCLVAGQTVSLTSENVRAIVADGLWSRFVYGSKPNA